MSNSIAVLQARTTSSRLPAKSLLPVGGYPLAVLSAKRAANTGRKVTLATSFEAADDALARAAALHNVPCFRGSLTNTLRRFVEALTSYDDDTLVFRLTADNAIPDGYLLDEMESYFVAQGLEYLRCGGDGSGLPYGVSAELVRLSHLRQADANTTSSYDREHVTPYVRRQHDAVYSKFRDLAKSHFRATVDTLDDYLQVEALFADQADPLHVPFLELIEALAKRSDQPIVLSPARRLVLGTAQLGMSYGIANSTGQPTQAEATDIVKQAITNGVSYIDTARAYAESEVVLGKALFGGWAQRVDVITKLSPLSECPENASRVTVEALVEASVYQSCRNLQCSTLDVLLLHRADHLYRWEGAVFDALKRLVAEGVIAKLGVSVQTAAELQSILPIAECQFVQIPFNILDCRYEGLISAIQDERAKRDLTIHVRGALLQGLLASTNQQLWRRAGVDDSAPLIHWLQQQAELAGCDSVVELCLKYCFSQTWIDGVVVGIESSEQLAENLRLGQDVLQSQALDRIASSRPQVAEHLLNPALWPKGD